MPDYIIGEQLQSQIVYEFLKIYATRKGDLREGYLS